MFSLPYVSYLFRLAASPLVGVEGRPDTDIRQRVVWPPSVTARGPASRRLATRPASALDKTVADGDGAAGLARETPVPVTFHRGPLENRPVVLRRHRHALGPPPGRIETSRRGRRPAPHIAEDGRREGRAAGHAGPVPLPVAPDRHPRLFRPGVGVEAKEDGAVAPPGTRVGRPSRDPKDGRRHIDRPVATGTAPLEPTGADSQLAPRLVRGSSNTSGSSRRVTGWTGASGFAGSSGTPGFGAYGGPGTRPTRRWPCRYSRRARTHGS